MSGEPQRTRPIAVFDSGVGGLTVLHELLVSLPHEDFLYLGDTARFPYGDRSAAELEGFTLQIADELLGRGAKLLVVACNSATSAALGALEAHVAARHDALDALAKAHPGVERRIRDDEGLLRRHVNLFAGGDLIRGCENTTELCPGERLVVLPAVSGG